MPEKTNFAVIPSVRDLRYLNQALKSPGDWVLLSSIHIGNLKEAAKKCHQAGKKVIVNHEIVGGLGSDRPAFQLLDRMYQVDGVMGSSNTKLAMARKEGMRTYRRVALEDSRAVDAVFSSLKETKSEVIKLRPIYYALRFLDDFKERRDCVYIAGGFIDSKELVDQAYQAGFSGVTTSCVELWNYNPGNPSEN